MLLITVHLQVPEVGIVAHIEWQPAHLHFVGHHDLVLAIDIVQSPLVPVVHITTNFAYTNFTYTHFTYTAEAWNWDGLEFELEFSLEFSLECGSDVSIHFCWRGSLMRL